MGEPPPRAERGGVRYLVLEAIAEKPRHGYEIIQHIEQRAGGSYRPSLDSSTTWPPVRRRDLDTSSFSPIETAT